MERAPTLEAMKAKHRCLLLSTGALLALGLFYLDPLQGLPGGTASPPSVRVDETPLERAEGVVASYAPAIRKALPSVVHIDTVRQVRQFPFEVRQFPFGNFRAPNYRLPPPKELEGSGSGSGVIVSEDGYILTNNHVVEGADQIRVRLSDDGSIMEAELVGTDPQTEIAVIRVEARDLPAITLADSDQLEMGDVVLAIGNPFGMGKTVTKGIVSAVGRSLTAGLMRQNDTQQIDAYIQTDAAISPGNSGGALVDAAGRLVGINTAIIVRGGGYGGIGLSVPSNLARSVMDQLVERGKVRRGYLGVGVQDLTEDLARSFGLEKAQGVLIAEVFEGGPAEEAGLQEEDVIVEVDSRPVKNRRSFTSGIATSPGKSLNLKVIRKGESLELEAALGIMENDRYLETYLSGKPWSNRGLAPDDSPALGLALEENGNFNQAFGQAFGRSVRVEQVEPGSPADLAGIRPGDVILKIEGEPAGGVRQVLERLRRSSGPVLLKIRRYGASLFVVIK